MSKYDTVEIGQVFNSIRNGASIKQGIVDGGYPITRIETIANRVVNRNKMGYAGIDDISAYSGYVLQTGDILMSHINSEKHLGKTAYYEKENEEIIIHGMNLLCLRPLEMLDYKFCNYFFQSDTFKQQIPSITKKSVNQASFTVTALKKLKMPLPPLETQKQIAKTLDTTVELRAMRKQQLAELDNLIKSVFYEMFGDPVVNEKGWSLRPIGYFSSVKIGPFGSLLHAEDYTQGGYPIVNPSHLIDGKVIPDMELTISEEKLKELQSYMMKRGDIVVGRRGEIGRCAIVEDEGLLCGTGSMFIRIERDYLPLVLQYIISSNSIKAKLEHQSVGVTMKNLNAGTISNLEVPIIPINLQENFVAIVTKIEEQKILVKKAIDETQYLFDSLMAQYFD